MKVDKNEVKQPMKSCQSDDAAERKMKNMNKTQNITSYRFKKHICI